MDKICDQMRRDMKQFPEIAKYDVTSGQNGMGGQSMATFEIYGYDFATTDMMAKELADALGGVLACTRPLAEENIMDAKHQIGLSGRTVKPKLIICLGISGAVQFAAGMKSSDCIVAVNTDKTAPIFDVAHYCVVGDVAEILPKLIAKIKDFCPHILRLF